MASSPSRSYKIISQEASNHSTSAGVKAPPRKWITSPGTNLETGNDSVLPSRKPRSLAAAWLLQLVGSGHDVAWYGKVKRCQHELPVPSGKVAEWFLIFSYFFMSVQHQGVKIKGLLKQRGAQIRSLLLEQSWEDVCPPAKGAVNCADACPPLCMSTSSMQTRADFKQRLIQDT